MHTDSTGAVIFQARSSNRPWIRHHMSDSAGKLNCSLIARIGRIDARDHQPGSVRFGMRTKDYVLCRINQDRFFPSSTRKLYLDLILIRIHPNDPTLNTDGTCRSRACVHGRDSVWRDPRRGPGYTTWPIAFEEVHQVKRFVAEGVLYS